MFKKKSETSYPDYPILSWSDYAIMHGIYKEIPTYRQYLNYRFWAWANGYTPYGGENACETEAYQKAVAYIKSLQIPIDKLIDE